jgi:hypothetical protein
MQSLIEEAMSTRALTNPVLARAIILATGTTKMDIDMKNIKMTS